MIIQPTNGEFEPCTKPIDHYPLSLQLPSEYSWILLTFEDNQRFQEWQFYREKGVLTLKSNYFAKLLGVALLRKMLGNSVSSTTQ